MNNIANTGLTHTHYRDIILVYDRQYGSRDQVPFVIECDWNDWLDIDPPGRTIFSRADVFIVIRLDRHTDKQATGLASFLARS